MRLLKVHELAPAEATAANGGWAAYAAATNDVTEASAEDVVGAGNVCSELRQILDTLGGPWSRGVLADKVYSGFTATGTAHGGQEPTRHVAGQGDIPVDDTARAAAA